MTIDEKIEGISESLAPGMIALFVLLFLMGPSSFYSWMIDKIILYLIIFFFFKIIANIIINRSFDRNEIKPLIFGIALFIPYVLLTSLTLLEILITLFQITAIISFFWVIMKKLKSAIANN